MTVATLSSKLQITLPVKICKALGLQPGDRLTIEIEADRVVVRKIPRSDVEALVAFASPVWAGYGDALQRLREAWGQ